MTPGQHPPGLVSVPIVDWMYSRAALSLMSISHNLPPRSQLDFTGGRSTICGKRNDAVEKLLSSDDLEWLLFLDSDMVFPPDVSARLLQHDADVVGGLYTLKAPDYVAVAGHERGERGDDPLRPTDGEAWKVETLDLRKVGSELGVVEVDVVGTGCMLIRRGVLEGMEPSWFAANENHSHGQNEDYNFCLRAKDAGFSVVCDTTLQLEHIGHHGVNVETARAYWRQKVEKERKRAAMVRGLTEKGYRRVKAGV